MKVKASIRVISTSQETPKVTSKPQKLGAIEQVFPHSLGGTSPADTLVSDLRLQHCETVNFCC